MWPFASLRRWFEAEYKAIRTKSWGWLKSSPRRTLFFGFFAGTLGLPLVVVIGACFGVGPAPGSSLQEILVAIFFISWPASLIGLLCSTLYCRKKEPKLALLGQITLWMMLAFVLIGSFCFPQM